MKLVNSIFQTSKIITVISFLSISLILVVSFFYSPSDAPQYSLCPFKNITRIDCPGCGLTRAFCSLAKGNLQKALDFHLLSPLIFAVFIMLWIYLLLELLGIYKITFHIKGLFIKFINKRLYVFFVYIFLITWVIRLLHNPLARLIHSK